MSDHSQISVVSMKRGESGEKIAYNFSAIVQYKHIFHHAITLFLFYSINLFSKMVRRALSLPATLGPQTEYGGKGIMKVKTLRDSLSSSEGKVQYSRRSNSVQFHDVSIREYNLVIGDNPSVSGGAPLR